MNGPAISSAVLPLLRCPRCAGVLEGEVTLTTPEGLQASHAEVSVPRYRRVFSLSKELDPEKIAAELAHGVLKLRIPKAEHAQPRKVQIRVS